MAARCISKLRAAPQVFRSLGRKAFRYSALGLLLMVAGCAGSLPAARTNSKPLDQTIYVLDHDGFHTDLALPAAILTGPLAQFRTSYPNLKFVLIGFGDRGYILAHRVTWRTQLRAAFPATGVMLVTVANAEPAVAFPSAHIMALQVSRAQAAAITGFVQNSFALDQNGALQWLENAPTSGGAFYASTQHYDLMHDCNHWTLAALQAGGLPVTPANVIFASEVDRQVAAAQ